MGAAEPRASRANPIIDPPVSAAASALTNSTVTMVNRSAAPGAPVESGIRTIVGMAEVTLGADHGERDRVWSKRADGGGAATLVAEEERQIYEAEWTRDGQWLVYRTDDDPGVVGLGDILAIHNGDHTPTPLVATGACCSTRGNTCRTTTTASTT